MHVLGRTRGAMTGGCWSLALLVAPSPPRRAGPSRSPGYKPGRASASSPARSFRWIGNRTQCFLRPRAARSAPPTSSTVGGGYWPAGTGNQYIFNSGLQIAGIVDSASAGNSWAGDIEGAFFFNARGGGNGQQITTIYDSGDPADLAAWPAGAYVPCDPLASIPTVAATCEAVRRPIDANCTTPRCRDRRRRRTTTSGS